METFFCPDGIGGKPGLVGKAGDAIWNGTPDLPQGASLLDTIGNSLGNIPHMLTDIVVKNPLEILKNPQSALNDQGKVSITRQQSDFLQKSTQAAGDQFYSQLQNFMQAPGQQSRGAAGLLGGKG